MTRVEPQVAWDIGVKSRDFGVKSRDWTGNWENGDGPKEETQRRRQHRE